MTVSLLVTLIVTAFATGLQTNQVKAGQRNQEVRSYVNSLTSTINKEVAAKRLDINQAMAKLQNKGSYALMNYMYNNPMVARNLNAIQKDTDLIAALQAEQNAIEAEINSLLNEYNQLGYNQDLSESSSKAEYYKAGGTTERVNKALARYDDLGKRIKSYKVSATNPVSTYSADIDARSQNINGGMK